MLRFKLEDLPPRLREQAERQLSPCSKSLSSRYQAESGGKLNSQPQPVASATTKLRPPITMKRKSEQSSAERRFNTEFLSGRGRFEALSLHLPGGSRYTPDFFVAPETNLTSIVNLNLQPQPILLVEVKGSYRLQSHARAATAFKTACACFPEFVFCWAELQKDGKSWKVTFFRDGQQIGECEEVEPKSRVDDVGKSKSRVDDVGKSKSRVEVEERNLMSCASLNGGRGATRHTYTQQKEGSHHSSTSTSHFDSLSSTSHFDSLSSTSHFDSNKTDLS